MAGDFGTRFMSEMALSEYADGQWSNSALVPSDSLTLHPGAHVFHYASCCFEGLKAFRHTDGGVVLFRPGMNIARFAQSARMLCLPEIDAAQSRAMIEQVLHRFVDDVPAPPSSMYIRPTLIGTEAAIGKAAAPSASALQYVLLSPVGDYFAGGEATLRLLLDDIGGRCAPDHGMVKAGGNYASALKHIERARIEHGAHQVLFCPGGDVQETGAANFLIIDGDELITKVLDESFLHGVTRDSLLTLAREQGMKVSERDLSIEELLERAAHPACEAGLSGTAAVLAAVGTLLHDGKEFPVGSGTPGPRLRALREQLNAIQWGHAEDAHDWIERL